MPPRSQSRKRRPDNKGRVTPLPFSDEIPHVWDRQPTEGDKAWECFRLYRDAEQEGGIGKRTQRAVADKVYPQSAKGADTAQRRKAPQVLSDWSVRFRWMERCEAFDRHLDRIRQEEFKKEAKRDAIQALALLRAMRAKAGHALVALPPAALSPSEITRMADTAIVGIRREAGLATDITSAEKDNAFAEWLRRGGDPDDEESEHDEPEAPAASRD